MSYLIISLLPHFKSLVTVSYTKKQRNQQLLGSEGRRKESCKLLDGIEFSKQYNNSSEASPLHSYQMRVKKGYVDVLFVSSYQFLFLGCLNL